MEQNCRDIDPLVAPRQARAFSSCPPLMVRGSRSFRPLGSNTPRMIKVVEGVAGSNKALKGLAVAVSFQAGENVQSEFYQVKDALLDWQHLRGEACAALELEYQADESIWNQIEQFWLAKIETDLLIRSLFATIGRVELCLITQNRSGIKRIGFELGKNE
jgi:hypothetical protein